MSKIKILPNCNTKKLENNFLQSNFQADLEEIYQKSLRAGKYSAALKAKELQLKKGNQFPVDENLVDHLLTFSLDDLNQILKIIEKKLIEPSADQ